MTVATGLSSFSSISIKNVLLETGDTEPKVTLAITWLFGSPSKVFINSTLVMPISTLPPSHMFVPAVALPLPSVSVALPILKLDLSKYTSWYVPSKSTGFIYRS